MEKVLVVPSESELVQQTLAGCKLYPIVQGNRALLRKTEYEWMPREDAEEDESYRQIIPYIAVFDRNDYISRILIMERLKNSGEKRLHNKLSIGIGGHINPVDSANLAETSLYNIIQEAAQREYNEEMNAKEPNELWLCGTLAIQDTPVDRVHLGVVFANYLNLQDAFTSPIIRETDKLDGALQPVQNLFDVYPRLEPWSQRVAKAILAGQIYAKL